MRQYHILLPLLCLLLSACAHPLPEPPSSGDPAGTSLASSEVGDKGNRIIADFSASFGAYSGSAVFLTPAGDCVVHNPEAAELQISPCSTFKIVSSLAALDMGTVTYRDSLMEWDDTEWPIPSWNQNMDIAEAFDSSCVWYYRKLIDQMGQESVQDYLDLIGYGNRDISQWEGSGFNGVPEIDGFWLESSLLISPLEQAELMARLFEGETGAVPEHLTALSGMMYTGELTDGTRLYGKTGSGRGGWFVGFFEREDSATYFAVRLDQKENANGQAAQAVAQSIIETYF